jgi:hypothetical protein
LGYRRTRDGQLEKEPDLRVQRALEFAFTEVRRGERVARNKADGPFSAAC